MSSGVNRRGRREPGKRYLVVCEGQSEQTYFLWVRDQLNTKSITIKSLLGKTSDPVAVAETALREASGNDRKGRVAIYDEVWAIVDWDGHTDGVTKARKLMADARESAGKEPGGTEFHLGLSNPCFEIWFLWHLQTYQTVGCLTEDVRKALKKVCPEYVKGRYLPVQKIAGHLADARKQAHQARHGHANVRFFPEDRPMSDIDILIDSIEAAWRAFRAMPAGATPPL